MSFDKALTADAGMSGKLRDNGWQFLPKASLQYSLTDGKGNVYLSVAKGYRSGGYNIQAYSDLSQTSLQRAMMTGTKAYSIETINSLPMSNEEKEKIIADIEKKMDPVTPDVPNFETLAYKPEYTWSYELGTHLNLLDNLLQLDLAAYYMKTRDQQLARFTQSGMGRVTVNSGRSRSTGLEATIKALLFEKRLTLVGGYSLTHATFTSYDLGENKQGENIDYSGNRVPFVPRHNFNLSGDYRHPLKNKIIRAVNLGADLRGAGEVFWDEANSRRQPFYVNLAVRAGVVLSHDVRLEIWARNLSNSRYTTFSFESMGRRYAQYCTPRHLGVDVSWKF